VKLMSKLPENPSTEDLIRWSRRQNLLWLPTLPLSIVALIHYGAPLVVWIVAMGLYALGLLFVIEATLKLRRRG
jgi:hypothetical protein